MTSHRSRWGKKPRLQGEAVAQLREKLTRPEGFQGYQSICTWLKDQLDLDVPYKTVHATVHYRLNGTPNVPRTSHVKKDPLREEPFKKKRSPTN